MNLIKIILKILISLVLSLGAFIAVAIFINEKLHGDDFWEITGGVIAGLTTLLFCYNYILKRKSFSGTIASGISLLRNTKDAITSDIDQKDADLFAFAEKEINEGNINQGLWSQALVSNSVQN